MISFILAESELELIPKKISSHPAVISHSKKQHKKITSSMLDSNYHHSAMRNLPDGRRRGRPDIAHIFLLSVLESIANKKNLIKKIIIHTRSDNIINVNPETRIMRNYTRFIGLMEQLFQNEIITANDTILLSLKKNISLNDLISSYKDEHIICFSDQGKPVSMYPYFKELKKQDKEDIICIIGGFPSGSFHSNFCNNLNDEISIHTEALTAWTVANEALVCYHQIFND